MTVSSQATLDQSTQADGRIYCVFEYTLSNGEKILQRVRLPAGANVTLVRSQYATTVDAARVAQEINDLID